ncbi:hypothetical protein E5288_WYG012349 [Bos mutus]|uniref:Uncharacterized protein n=1 Tax=Bos mutus TaxID=72004 RepID=A0A6B0RQE0_9CETA|nr:hypothetical protein [Bos mutus]
MKASADEDPQMLQRALTFVTRLKIQLHMCVSYTDKMRFLQLQTGENQNSGVQANRTAHERVHWADHMTSPILFPIHAVFPRSLSNTQNTDLTDVGKFEAKRVTPAVWKILKWIQENRNPHSITGTGNGNCPLCEYSQDDVARQDSSPCQVPGYGARCCRLRCSDSGKQDAHCLEVYHLDLVGHPGFRLPVKMTIEWDPDDPEECHSPPEHTWWINGANSGAKLVTSFAVPSHCTWEHSEHTGKLSERINRFEQFGGHCMFEASEPSHMEKAASNQRSQAGSHFTRRMPDICSEQMKRLEASSKNRLRPSQKKTLTLTKALRGNFRDDLTLASKETDV